MDRLEVWAPGGIKLLDLTGAELAIGRDDAAGLTIGWDPRVSGVHALLARVANRWIVRDAGSSNGTLVNGERIWRDCQLTDGDEIQVGGTKLIFRSLRGVGEVGRTVGLGSPPPITRREREVLLELCRPVFSSEAFRLPASIKVMAGRLYVTEAAVKQHLLHLFEKFGVEGEGAERRARLANEAIRLGAVSLGEIAAAASEGPEDQS